MSLASLVLEMQLKREFSSIVFDVIKHYRTRVFYLIFCQHCDCPSLVVDVASMFYLLCSEHHDR